MAMRLELPQERDTDGILADHFEGVDIPPISHNQQLLNPNLSNAESINVFNPLDYPNLLADTQLPSDSQFPNVFNPLDYPNIVPGIQNPPATRFPDVFNPLNYPSIPSDTLSCTRFHAEAECVWVQKTPNNSNMRCDSYSIVHVALNFNVENCQSVVQSSLFSPSPSSVIITISAPLVPSGLRTRSASPLISQYNPGDRTSVGVKLEVPCIGTSKSLIVGFSIFAAETKWNTVQSWT